MGIGDNNLLSASFSVVARRLDGRLKEATDDDVVFVSLCSRFELAQDRTKGKGVLNILIINKRRTAKKKMVVVEYSELGERGLETVREAPEGK